MCVRHIDFINSYQYKWTWKSENDLQKYKKYFSENTKDHGIQNTNERIMESVYFLLVWCALRIQISKQKHRLDHYRKNLLKCCKNIILFSTFKYCIISTRRCVVAQGVMLLISIFFCANNVPWIRCCLQRIVLLS